VQTTQVTSDNDTESSDSDDGEKGPPDDTVSIPAMILWMLE